MLLAAGRSARFGGDKLLASLDGHAVLFWSAAAIATAVDALYVVVPPGARSRMQAVASFDPVFVEHVGRDEGMASSIRAGIAALPEMAEAVVIALADQPLVSGEVVRRLCARWRSRECGDGKMGEIAAVAPMYRDGRGHPVLFGRSTFFALSALHGDAGARCVLDTLGDAVVLVTVDDTIPLDVDTPDELRALTTDRRRDS